jgi:putative endonuclease
VFSPAEAYVLRILQAGRSPDAEERVVICHEYTGSLERNEDSLPDSGVFYVYILRCGDGTLYTGYTNDLEARLAAHRNGKGAKYTRGRGPLELVYEEVFDNNIAAMKRERQIQKQTRAQKEHLLRG